MFSGYLVSVTSMLTTFSSVVWLPLAILFFDKALLDKGVLSKLLTPAVLACMFLAGEPSIFYTTSWVLLIYSVFLWRGNASVVKFRTVIVTYLAIIAGAVLLSSVQLIPLLEILKLSDRTDTLSKSMLYDFAARWSMPPSSTLDFIFPFFARTDFSTGSLWVEQNWVMLIYTGVFSPVLLLLSYIRRGDWRVRFLFFTLILFLLVSYGKYTPVHHLLYRIVPGFRFIRYPVRFLFVVTFAISILSAFGLDVCAKELKDRWSDRMSRRYLAFFLAAAISLLTLSLNIEKLLEFNKSPCFTLDIFNIERFILYLLAGGMILFLSLRGKIRRAVMCFAIIGLAAVDIMGTSQDFALPSAAAGIFSRKTAGIEYISKDASLFRVYSSPKTMDGSTFLKPAETFEEALEDLKDKFVSNWPMIFGLYDAGGYDSLYLASHVRTSALMRSMSFKDARGSLSMMNVKYIALVDKVDVDGYKLVSEGPTYIYENTKVLPRAYLVDSYKVLKNDGEIMARLGSREFEPGREVVLEETPVLGAQKSEVRSQRSEVRSQRSEGRGQRTERVEIEKYEPNEVVIKAVVGERPKLLFLSDTYYPGWKVFVDGKRDKIYKANCAFRAVYLAPGEHTVRFIFDPFTFKLGAVISLMTLAGIIIYLIRRFVFKIT